MVKFEKNKYIIEVETGGNPVEDWLNTFKEILNLVGTQNQDFLESRIYTTSFLMDMMPTWEDAIKMFPDGYNLENIKTDE